MYYFNKSFPAQLTYFVKKTIMNIGTIDYTLSYFKYKIPTPIREVPMHKLLKHLK